MKKLVSILLLVCLLMSVSIVSASAADDFRENHWVAETPDIDPDLLPGTVIGKLGDADQSQTINVKDATTIQKHVASIIVIADDFLILADADLSGDITVRDATAVQKWLAGMSEDSLVGNAIYTPFAPDENLIGTWENTTDGAGVINELIPMLSDDPLLIEHVSIDTFIIKQTYTFNEDGSYTITVDEAVLADSIAEVKLDLQGDMKNYLEAVAEEFGMSMSADQMLQLMGYSSMADLLEEMFPMDMLEEIIVPTEGYYRTANGKLYMDEYSDTFYEDYTIEGDVMTITDNSEGLFPEEYPVIFNRVG